MRTHRTIARALLSAGTLLAAGMLTVGLTSAAFASSPRCETGQLQVIKTDSAGTPLIGAGFTLYTVAKDGSPGSATQWSVQISKLDNGIAVATTAADVTPGTYWVVETTVPAGYRAAASQKVTIDAGQLARATFKDDPLPGSVVVTKTDTAGRPVAGAAFTLYTNAGVVTSARTSSPGTSTGLSCAAATVVKGVASCTVSGVVPGTYWVEETTVPAGYSPAAPQQVTVLPATAAAAVTFVDTPRPPTDGSVTITKTDASGAALAGAGFTLYADADGAPGASTGWSSSLTTVVGGVAAVTISPVTPGVYWVEETTVPSGYVAGAPQKVTVTAGGDVSVTFVDVAAPPSSPSSGGTTPTAATVPVVTGVPIVAATTVHTGMPFAGSLPLVMGVGILGLAMALTGVVLRRRARA